MVWCGSKDGHQKDMCLKEIGLCAKNIIIIPCSIIIFWRGPIFDHLMSMILSTLKTMRKVAMALIWIFKPFHYNRVFHILGEVG